MTWICMAIALALMLPLSAQPALAQADHGHVADIVSYDATSSLALVARCTASGDDGVVSVVRTRTGRKLASVTLGDRHDICNVDPSDSVLDDPKDTPPRVRRLVEKYSLYVRPVRLVAVIPHSESVWPPLPLQNAHLLVTLHERELCASLFVGSKRVRTWSHKPAKPVFDSSGQLHAAWHPNGKLVGVHGGAITAQNDEQTVHEPVLLFWSLKPSRTRVPPAALVPQVARFASHDLDQCRRRVAAQQDFAFHWCERASKANIAIAKLQPTRAPQALYDAVRAASLNLDEAAIATWCALATRSDATSKRLVAAGRTEKDLTWLRAQPKFKKGCRQP